MTTITGTRCARSSSTPTSHNIEWHAVTSLLEAVGTVTVHHDGKVTVTVGSERAIFDPPAGKDIDVQMVVDLRHMLARRGTARPMNAAPRGG